MVERTLLLPQTLNPPAKVKDPGIIGYVKKGYAAYNAKTAELLLLPKGEEKRREMTERLRQSLFAEAGLQPVNCGNDAAIRSIAERFAREWGSAALSFSDERGREIHVHGWCRGVAEADSRIEEIRASLTGTLGGGKLYQLVEHIPTGSGRAYHLLSLTEPGAIGALSGLTCPACGRLFLHDSPFPHRPVQPGASEEPMSISDIETPGANTILELCNQLNLDIRYTIKAMLYIAYDSRGNAHPIASFVRGDYNISMNKLSRWLETQGMGGLRTAEKAELFEMIGEVAGYCGPVGLPENVLVVCDESICGSINTVIGANRPGYHRKGCCHGRDYNSPIADIAGLTEGTPCVCGDAALMAAMLRDCGEIAWSDAVNDAEKMKSILSYRDREGMHAFPLEWDGCFYVDRILFSADMATA